MVTPEKYCSKIYGCPAVDDLICKTTLAASCTGNVAPACTAALDLVAAQLDAGFKPSGTVDFTLSGQCMAADTDGDLVIDTLTQGSWMMSVSTDATFTGAKE